AVVRSACGVEPRPSERVDRSLRIRHRSAPRSVIRVLEHPVRVLFVLANGFFGAMMLLIVVGTVLSIAFSIIGGVASAMFGHDGPPPTTVVAVPPSVQPIDDMSDTVTDAAQPILDDRPTLSDDRRRRVGAQVHHST